jgi:hypothetical protein
MQHVAEAGKGKDRALLAIRAERQRERERKRERETEETGLDLLGRQPLSRPRALRRGLDSLPGLMTLM